MEHTIQIDFHDDKIMVWVENDKPYVALKPIAESLGLSWARQFRTLKSDIVLSTCIATRATQVSGQKRKMVFLPLQFLNGWLFKINARNYQGERQERLVAYQRECYQVLNDYFMHGGAINPEASASQLIGLQGRIDYYQQFMPQREQGTESMVSGRDRTLLVRSYYRAHPRKSCELHPDLLDLIGFAGE